MKPSNNNLTIRPATPTDIPLILQLIKELAAYEKLLDQVVATEAQLHEAHFGERPLVETLLAEVAGKTAAFALFFHNFSTFLGRPGLYLEDLYVRPAFRGQGIGRAMLIRLAQEAQARNCGRLTWEVLTWNEPALRLYESIGGQPHAGWQIYQLSGPALAELATQNST